LGGAADSVSALWRREKPLAVDGDEDMAKKMMKCSYTNYNYDLS
jgi:hypothetical protein